MKEKTKQYSLHVDDKRTTFAIILLLSLGIFIPLYYLKVYQMLTPIYICFPYILYYLLMLINKNIWSNMKMSVENDIKRCQQSDQLNDIFASTLIIAFLEFVKRMYQETRLHPVFLIFTAILLLFDLFDSNIVFLPLISFFTCLTMLTIANCIYKNIQFMYKFSKFPTDIDITQIHS